MSKRTKEVRALAPKDMQARIAELRKEMIKTAGQVATGSAPKNPYQIRNAKRSVARMLTVLREGELRAGKEAKKE